MILGIQINQIIAEKKKNPSKDIVAKNGLRILEVREEKLPIESQKTLSIPFNFTVSYEPKIATIEIKGALTYLHEEKKLKEILDTWKKEKHLPKDIAPVIMNQILSQCNIKALQLSKDLNLPPHIPFPRIVLRQESK